MRRILVGGFPVIEYPNTDEIEEETASRGRKRCLERGQQQGNKDSPIPVIDWPHGQDDLGLRICTNKVFRETDAWVICHCLAVSEDFVELVATERFAFALEFRLECFVPQLAVSRILHVSGEAVVDVIDAE